MTETDEGVKWLVERAKQEDETRRLRMEAQMMVGDWMAGMRRNEMKARYVGAIGQIVIWSGALIFLIGAVIYQYFVG